MGFGFDSIISGGLEMLNSAHTLDRQADMSQHAMDFTRDQTQASRDFTEMMSNTAYQRATRDMQAAGLNPMLAYSQGGSSTPSSPSGAGVAATAQKPDLIGALQLSSANALREEQTANVKAQTANTEADTNVKTATEQEIKARTPTYAVSMDALKVQIAHTMEDIQRVQSQTKLNVSSAAQAEQQTTNLKALVNQVEATVRQLNAQTKATAAQTGLTDAQHREVTQRITANLPAAEAALLKVKQTLAELEKPQAGMRAATYSTPIGAISEMMRALNPLQGLFSK